MSGSELGLSSRAAALRAAFDRSFAEPPAAEPTVQLDLLAIRLADHGYALRLSDVVAVHAERPIVPVPGPTPELLGLVGVRAQILPVYDLARLLGHGAAPVVRWLVQVRAKAPLALGFEVLEAHLRVPLHDVVAAQGGAPAAQPFTGGGVLTPAGPRPLIDLAALVARLTGNEEST